MCHFLFKIAEVKPFCFFALQVIQKSKQWWLVRNQLGDEGNVPQRILETMRSNGVAADSPVCSSTRPPSLLGHHDLLTSLLSSTANQPQSRIASDSGHDLLVAAGQSLAGVQRLLQNVRHTK